MRGTAELGSGGEVEGGGVNRKEGKKKWGGEQSRKNSHHRQYSGVAQ